MALLMIMSFTGDLITTTMRSSPKGWPGPLQKTIRLCKVFSCPESWALKQGWGFTTSHHRSFRNKVVSPKHLKVRFCAISLKTAKTPLHFQSRGVSHQSAGPPGFNAVRGLVNFSAGLVMALCAGCHLVLLTRAYIRVPRTALHFVGLCWVIHALPKVFLLPSTSRGSPIRSHVRASPGRDYPAEDHAQQDAARSPWHRSPSKEQHGDWLAILEGTV